MNIILDFFPLGQIAQAKQLVPSQTIDSIVQIFIFRTMDSDRASALDSPKIYINAREPR